MATIAKMYVEVNARLGSLVKDLEKAGGAVADMSQKMKAAFSHGGTKARRGITGLRAFLRP